MRSGQSEEWQCITHLQSGHPCKHKRECVFLASQPNLAEFKLPEVVQPLELAKRRRRALLAKLCAGQYQASQTLQLPNACRIEGIIFAVRVHVTLNGQALKACEPSWDMIEDVLLVGLLGLCREVSKAWRQIRCEGGAVDGELG
jgi:hypothetical protein